MIFELMSEGKIVRLPDTMNIDGLPEKLLPRVILLLPFNRVLVGTCMLDNMDSWFYGKLGTGKWKEVFLYEDSPLVLGGDDIPDIELDQEQVVFLKEHLLVQLSPPGNHVSTLLVLKGLRTDLGIFNDGNTWTNETWVLSHISKNIVLRRAYWGIRKALVHKNTPMLERIKTWFNFASDIDFEPFGHPQIWFSLTELPGETDLAEIEGLGFTRDNLLKMNSNFSNPVVLSNALGYLVLMIQYSGDEYGELRVWMYLTMSMWEDLRRKKKMSIKEIVHSGWGYLDAIEADQEMSRYGKLREGIELAHENGSKV